MKESFSDLTLEQYLLDELPEPVRKKLEIELSRDPTLRLRIESMRDSNRQILDENDKAEVVAKIRLRLKNREINREWRLSEKGRRRRTPWMFALPAIALAVVTLSVVMPVYKNQSPVVTEDGIRLKGLTPSLHIYQKTARGVTLLNDGVKVKKGDDLQLSYVAVGARYGMIVSVDGRGVVTLHFPYDEKNNELTRDGEVVLQRSYELDDAPRFERFYFLSSENAFDVKPILDRIKQTTIKNDLFAVASIDGLPANIRQTSQLLLKVQ